MSLLSGRAGAARFLLPLSFVVAMAAAAAMAQDNPDAPVEDPGVSEPGDPGEGGEWVDDPIAWNEVIVEPFDGEEYLHDGGDVMPVSDCDGCEVQTFGGERPVMENARGDLAARPNPRGKEGGTCSEDGFIPLPWRCSW
jgi:hypothetical protein